jgi:D-serine deaminase-like pyridoxal phosphate-dependent protein
MKLADLPTPCLVLERPILQRNLETMAQAVARHGLTLRPHMKTAKSIDVARMAMAVLPARPTGLTVSTLAEAEYFVGHGIADIVYAVGITPQKLNQVARLNAAGGAIAVVTDDADMAGIIAAHPNPPRTLIEVDTGEHRGGVAPESAALLDIAARLGGALAGVLTHAGQSYAGRTRQQMAAFAEAERSGVALAADRLRAAGFGCDIVSMGSSPTALHAEALSGVTEIRAGVYMFGDLFQAGILTHGIDDVAVTVLTSVIGRRPAERVLVVDAGGIALSKDRSTEGMAQDWGFGRVLDIGGQPSLGHSLVRRAYQEHGMVALDPGIDMPDLPIGTRLRIAPNHVCMTAAAHDRYFVVDGTDSVAAIWPRVNGW